ACFVFFAFLSFILPPPPRSTLFPYTTLFRSLTLLQGIETGFSTLEAGAPEPAAPPRAGRERLHRPERRRLHPPDHHLGDPHAPGDRKSTRLNSSHDQISYAVFCLKKKKKTTS